MPGIETSCAATFVGELLTLGPLNRVSSGLCKGILERREGPVIEGVYVALGGQPHNDNGPTR